MDNMDIVFETFAPIFTRFPFIEKISWEQYTPYDLNTEFNLKVVKESIKINDNNITPLINLNLRKRIDRLLSKTSFLENTFGDHVTVTINKDSSIIIKECHHG